LESTKSLIKKRLFKVGTPHPRPSILLISFETKQEYEMVTAPESEAAAKQSVEEDAEKSEVMGKELALFSQEHYAKLHSSLVSEIPSDDEFQKMKQDKHFIGFVRLVIHLIPIRTTHSNPLLLPLQSDFKGARTSASVLFSVV